MRVPSAVALVVLVLLPLGAAQAATSLFDLASSTYDPSASLWTYTYVIDNTLGNSVIYDVLLQHVSDASVKESPVGWTSNPAVFHLGLDGSLGWSTPSGGSYTVPVGSFSNDPGVLTGNFVITSPYHYDVNAPPTAAFTFDDNRPPGGFVNGPTYTPEPGAAGVMLSGLAFVGLIAWKRRKSPAPRLCC